MALPGRAPDATLASVLARRATSDPESPYVRWGDGVVTAGRIDADAEALAASLSHLGIGPGDRVAVVLPPCPEFVVAVFAAAKLGGVVVPMSPRASTVDLQYMLRHSEASCAITIEQGEQGDYLQVFEDLMPQLPDLQYVVTVGEEDLWYDDRIFQYEDLLSAGAGRDYAAGGPHGGEPDDVFALVYTSGTMGKPKGVELSHAALLAAAAGTAEGVGLRPDDRVVGITSFHHVFGLAAGLLSTLLAGASIVVQGRTDPGGILDAIERHGATVLYGIPTLFVSELEEQERRPRDLGTLRMALVAGAPVADELVPRLAETLGVTVLTGYTLTEMASMVTMTRPSDPDWKRRFTVGRPLEATEVRILGPDGEDLPVESVGEIALRGPGMMRGYYRQPRQTAATYAPDGFLRSGDLGLLDEEGYLHLVGRTKDVIIRSGFNVHPREVEARIESHPAVQETAVIGIADPLLGEAVCACVVPVEGAIVTEAEILDWCREVLADEKVPDLVRFVDDLPRDDTGRLRRGELARRVKAARQSS